MSAKKHQFAYKKYEIKVIAVIIGLLILIFIVALPSILDFITDIQEDKYLENEKTEYLEKLSSDYNESKDYFEIAKKAFEGKYQIFQKTLNDEYNEIYGKYFLSENGDLTAKGNILENSKDFYLSHFTDEEISALQYILNELKFSEINFCVTSDDSYIVTFIRYSPSHVTQKTQYHYNTISSYGISYATNSYMEYIKENNSHEYRYTTIDMTFKEDEAGVWGYYAGYNSYS